MRKIFLLLSIFLFAGCAHAPVKKTYLDDIKKIAILPFADYSYQQSFVEPVRWGLNNRIIEEVTDEFLKRGVMVIPQEDVNEFLVDEEIMKPVETEGIADALSRITDSLKDESVISAEYELTREHSEEMVEEVNKIASEGTKKKEAILNRISEALYVKEPFFQGVTSGLTKNKVIDFGSKIGVDAIVRGRIIEGGVLKRTSNPAFANQGIVPFLLKPIKTMIVGQSDSKLSLGYAYKDKYEEDLSSEYDFKPYPTGENTSVVQIRIYLQDAHTGEILWSGRKEAVCNGLIFKSYYKNLFDRATKESVSSLVADLFKGYRRRR
ncbi:hypothetical protein EPO66_01590 [bacterium]|nr:MAG: hypothetical protein EPO66_01590 [bacterium]